MNTSDHVNTPISIVVFYLLMVILTALAAINFLINNIKEGALLLLGGLSLFFPIFVINALWRIVKASEISAKAVKYKLESMEDIENKANITDNTEEKNKN